MPKKKANDRPEIDNKTEGTVSRRNVLKIGAAAGAATVLAPHIMAPAEALGFDGGVIAPPLEQCLVGNSPAHTPFKDSLPIPFPALPNFLSPAPQEHPNLGAMEADRAPHQR